MCAAPTTSPGMAPGTVTSQIATSIELIGPGVHVSSWRSTGATGAPATRTSLASHSIPGIVGAPMRPYCATRDTTNSGTPVKSLTNTSSGAKLSSSGAIRSPNSAILAFSTSSSSSAACTLLAAMAPAGMTATRHASVVTPLPPAAGATACALAAPLLRAGRRARFIHNTTSRLGISRSSLPAPRPRRTAGTTCPAAANPHYANRTNQNCRGRPAG